MLAAKIQAHARRAPERVAVVYNNNRLPYGQFVRLIEASRRYLSERVRTGTGVAVLAISSMLDAWVQGLALRSLGITTLAVPPPRDNIGGLGLAEIACVVVTEAEPSDDIEAACAASGWPFIRIPRAVYASAGALSLSQLSEPSSTPGGHILLTSGTTGIYKKVLISPVGEAAIVAHRQKILGITERSVVDVFHCGGWTGNGYKAPADTWDAGGCIVMYQGPRAYEALLHPGITHAYVNMNVLPALLASPPGALRCNPSMRLFVGGAPLAQTVAQEARARLTPRIYTTVSSTEASQFANTPIETPDDLLWHRIIESRDVQIVDDDGRALPVGQVGNLRVSTLGVTGYLNDDEATHRFFRDGYFYSGDLGCLRADGRLMLQGRATDIVNIRGSKFAPGPLEAALRDHFRVSGVCVFSARDGSEGEVVHVALETTRTIEPSEYSASLAGVLPAVVGARFHILDALPRDQEGKLQRDVLKRQLGL